MAAADSSPTRSRSARRADAEQKLTEVLIALLEAGTTPWRHEWDAAGCGHHVNLISGRRYRGANPVLLTLGMHLRGSALPFWCGFGEGKTRGLSPRKGSKAVYVLQPQVHVSPAEDATAPAPDGSAPEGVTHSWVTYRPIPVFNAADLVGEALPTLIQTRREAQGVAQRSEPERLATAEAMLSSWPVEVVHGGSQACYRPALDCIQLPERAAFESPAALYATWGHEAVHSTGHPARLARDLSGVMGSRAYAREELVAELGAVLLGERLEIGSNVANHAAYVSSWIALLRESPRVLVEILGDARRAVDLICPDDTPHAATDADVGERTDQASG
jgi:antirestriction protein ArdC